MKYTMSSGATGPRAHPRRTADFYRRRSALALMTPHSATVSARRTCMKNRSTEVSVAGSARDAYDPDILVKLVASGAWPASWQQAFGKRGTKGSR